MKKVLIILICLCLLFPVNIVLADEKLVYQENFDGFSMNVGEGECIAQRWEATDLQIYVTNISIYINNTTSGIGVAGIASDSPEPPYDHTQDWLVNDSKPLNEMNGWVDFPNVDCSVTEGAYYWLLFKVLEDPEPPDVNAQVHGSIDNPYPNGTLWFYERGVGWENHSDKDMAFRIYGNEIVQPIVKTLNATHVEDTHARLWGKILNDGREDCNISFQIKEDDGIPWNTSWHDSYNTNDTFYEIVTGLNPGTEYHFRAGAKNSNNTTWGNWESFTTDVCDNIPEGHAVLFFPLFDESQRREIWWEEYNLTMSVLESHGWTNIYLLLDHDATEENLISTLRNLSDDHWDTTLIVIASHGLKGSFQVRGGPSGHMLTYKNFSDNGVDYLNSSGIAIVVEACYSGSALWDNQSLKQDGRIILTSQDDDTKSTLGLIKMVALSINDYGDYMRGDSDEPIGNRNGAVSMNEVYYHILHEKSFNGWFWRGYPYNDTEMPEELHITFQNWTTGRIDQLFDRTFSYGCAPGNVSYVYKRTTGEVHKIVQLFIPQFDTLTKVQINMRRSGGLHLNSPIKIEIRKGGDVPGDTLLTEKTILPGELDPIVDLPEGNGRSTYITFDINDTDNFTQGETLLYILIEATDTNDAYEYKIGSWASDYYDKGCLYVWNWSESQWNNFSDYDMWFITYGLNSSNMPPHTPKRPGGPDEGYACVSYGYNVTTTDMDGDDVYYYIDWGDNTNFTTDWKASGDIVQVNHSWGSSGVYLIKVKAIDENWQESNWSDVYVVIIVPNDPPNAPIIDGPTKGKAGTSYTYTFTSTDPDGDNVSYYIKWGDGNITDWTAFQASGTPYSESHTWSAQGTYNITAKAKDTYGAEGDWGYLEVEMPVNIFGYTISGALSQNIKNKISGSSFTMLANGTADNITAYIQTNLSTPSKTKCMIYRNNDSSLIGTTEEKTLDTGDDGAWVIYNFSDSKPVLVKDTEYILVCWSNDTCNLYYDNASDNSYGRCKTHAYGDAPTPSISWDYNESRLYSIYCIYSTVLEVMSASASPNTIGFGFNTTITAEVELYGVFVDTINVSITYSNNVSENFSMTQIDNDTFQYTFDDTWVVGQYNYSIWVVDIFGASCSSTGHSFNVSADATISVCTIKDSFGNNETINLTDPPGDPPLIGYELLDNDDVLHIWNKYNSYYFDTNSGIQLTNHYDEYWSHNVLMLGYYNNNEWNLIYRTDELSGFNKNIETDNETYVNATLWKDLTYQGYDFRLAIRYHLGLDDSDLTVIPYIKNLGQEIPYTLGFGWEIKDIRIANVEYDNYLQVFNGTGFERILLSQSVDKSFTDMDHNTTIKLICTNPPTYHLSRSLYLTWDESLNYKVTVKTRSGQYNAPVTLFVKIGTLDVGQEKYTQMHWLDSDSWLGLDGDNCDSWCCDDGFMTPVKAMDGTGCWCAPDKEVHWLILDLGSTYNITKVRGRSDTPKDPTKVNVYVSDSKTSWGTAVATDISTWQDTSTWQEVDTTYKDGRYIKIEITETEEAAAGATDFGNPEFPFVIFDAYGDIANTTNQAPEVSNPYPSDNSSGIGVAPLLNITVVDPDGDSMNITWLSNSSGSWVAFGWNNTASNGTYHQTMVNASVNGAWWYWKVNVYDGTNYAESSVYKFYTGYESKIVNTGSTVIKGYLLMQVQYYNETSESWVVADDTVNESSPRAIPWDDPYNFEEPNILALDTIFNGLVNTQDLSEYGNGTYRVYAAFRDPDGNVLVCDDETELVATYEFTVTFS